MRESLARTPKKGNLVARLTQLRASDMNVGGTLDEIRVRILPTPQVKYCQLGAREK